MIVIAFAHPSTSRLQLTIARSETTTWPGEAEPAFPALSIDAGDSRTAGNSSLDDRDADLQETSDPCPKCFRRRAEDCMAPNGGNDSPSVRRPRHALSLEAPCRRGASASSGNASPRRQSGLSRRQCLLAASRPVAGRSPPAPAGGLRSPAPPVGRSPGW